ncbi:MAG: hypothetical protein Q9213_002465 [Squamulea squamosa]
MVYTTVPFLKSLLLMSIILLSSSPLLSTAAQAGLSAFTIYNDTGRLPSGCIADYSSAHDEVLYTVPYTYPQVLSIIGSFANITWNGDNSTTLNGSDNTVGTARTYEYYGIRLIETIKTYLKPEHGPYFEDHTIAPSYNPATNLSLYASTDALTATPICGGTAVALNFTVDFCATDVGAAGAIFHELHVADARILQEFLGNDTWSGCGSWYRYGYGANRGGSGSETKGVLPNGTVTATVTAMNGSESFGGYGGYYGYESWPTTTPIAFTGGATRPWLGIGVVVVASVVLFL